MPSYEIYYRDQDGRLVEKFSVDCATPMQAKILAHAMKVHPFAEIEVWLEDALVYERPERRMPDTAASAPDVLRQISR